MQHIQSIITTSNLLSKHPIYHHKTIESINTTSNLSTPSVYHQHFQSINPSSYVLIDAHQRYVMFTANIHYNITYNNNPYHITIPHPTLP